MNKSPKIHERKNQNLSIMENYYSTQEGGVGTEETPKCHQLETMKGKI